MYLSQRSGAGKAIFYRLCYSLFIYLIWKGFFRSKYGDLTCISELTENDDDDLYEYIKMLNILYADDTVIQSHQQSFKCR